jgi:hypothetical protein
MAEYLFGIRRKYGKLPRQVALYVGEAPLLMEDLVEAPTSPFVFIWWTSANWMASNCWRAPTSAIMLTVGDGSRADLSADKMTGAAAPVVRSLPGWVSSRERYAGFWS